MEESVFECETRAYQCTVCGLTTCVADCPGLVQGGVAVEVVFAAAGRLMKQRGIQQLVIQDAWSWSDTIVLGDEGVLWAMRQRRSVASQQGYPLS